MTQLKIHWWNMVFHKRVAISVTLSAWTGGTATFSPASGTSYALSSLPVGTTIVLESSTYKFKLNWTQIGILTITPSSWYQLSIIEVIRWWVKTTVTSTPITLENWDTIWVTFEAITMRIRFYNNSLWSFYNELTWQYISDWWYADIPRADALHFKPYSQTSWIIEIYKDWVWTSVVDYVYNTWQEAYILAIPSSSWQKPDITFIPNPGSYYEFPTMWWLQSWYQYLDGSTFAFQTAPTPACELATYQYAWLQDANYLRTFFEQNVLYNNPAFSPVMQVMNYEAPNWWVLNYVLYDGVVYGMFLADIMYIDHQSWQVNNTKIYIPFTYDWLDMICYPYEDDSRSWLFVPRDDTNLIRPASGYINDVFYNWVPYVLEMWMQIWNCGDICDLVRIISALANWYYQNL